MLLFKGSRHIRRGSIAHFPTTPKPSSEDTNQQEARRAIFAKCSSSSFTSSRNPSPDQSIKARRANFATFRQDSNCSNDELAIAKLKRATFTSQDSTSDDVTRSLDAIKKVPDEVSPKRSIFWNKKLTKMTADPEFQQDKIQITANDEKNMKIRRQSFATCSKSLNIVTTEPKTIEPATDDLHSRRASFATCSKSLPMYPTWATINPINTKNQGRENLDEQPLSRKPEVEAKEDPASDPASLRRYPTWATINPISNQKGGPKSPSFTKNSSAPSDLDSMTSRDRFTTAAAPCVTPQNTPDSPKFKGKY